MTTPKNIGLCKMQAGSNESIRIDLTYMTSTLFKKRERTELRSSQAGQCILKLKIFQTLPVNKRGMEEILPHIPQMEPTPLTP